MENTGEGATTDVSNNYYCLRHGRSLANEAGLIISDPVVGGAGWGLVNGAEAKITATLLNLPLGTDTLIFSSPFLRARETAEAAAGVLGSSYLFIADELKERWFGNWEGGSHSNYQKVWALDKEDTGNRNQGVESPVEVLGRMRKLIRSLDSKYHRKNILLVSHGDPLDILLTWAGGLPLGSHMQLGMKTGEIRRLELPVSSSKGT